MDILAFTPEISDALPPPVAPDETLIVDGVDSASVTPVITQSGSPVTADSLTILTQPTHGSASVSGLALVYTPTPGYVGADTFTYKATAAGIDSNVATVTATVPCNYNCNCDDTTNNKTLKQLRDDLARRLGYGAQVNNLPPGMTDLLNSFLIEAQELLYRRYDVLRTERFYTWNMQAGVRRYDLDANRDVCTKRLDPRKITWAGVSQGCIDWTELRCGINPLLYSHATTGRPAYYEIRQCIEVWPPPADDSYQLRIKGHFGLEPFSADTDKTTIDDRPVFLLALANAKAHYGKSDAKNYIQQMETLLMGLVAGAHQTRRYIPGRDRSTDYVYTAPKTTVPFT